jgi:hypothetical protein
MGTDIGASLASSATSGAGQNNAFNVTGGGGGNAPGASSALNLNVIALAFLGVAGLLIAVFLIFKRK